MAIAMYEPAVGPADPDSLCCDSETFLKTYKNKFVI
jgi:hypothetical protein